MKLKPLNNYMKICMEEFSEQVCSDYFTIVKRNSTLTNSEIITTYPNNWMEQYLGEKLWKSDPAYQCENNIYRFWGEKIVESTNTTNEVILNARDYSIRSGVTIQTPLLSGVSYDITISSQRELEAYKKDISPVTISQVARSIALLDVLFSAFNTKEDFEKLDSFLKYDFEIYKKLNLNHLNSVNALETIQKELSFSAHYSSNDFNNRILNHWKKKISIL